MFREDGLGSVASAYLGISIYGGGGLNGQSMNPFTFLGES